MHTLVCDLLDRAHRVGAALSVFDDQDRAVISNEKHSLIYNFIEFDAKPSYEEILWQCIHHHKLAEPTAYDNPAEWVRLGNEFRRRYEFAQFITRHSDGRTLLVFYEKIRDGANWSYYARIDITKEVRTLADQGQCLIGPAMWNGLFPPLARTSVVPVNSMLETVPTAAALITEKGRLLDANRAFHRLLACGDGLIQVEDRVTARLPAERPKFQRKLSRFFQGPDAAAAAIRISRIDSEDPYFATLTGMVHRPWFPAEQGCAVAMLTVANPVSLPVIDPNLLTEFFQLTPAEAAVAAELGMGRTVQEIAAAKGVAANTVYCQVKSITAKTGFKGQTDIARQVAALSCLFGRRH